MHRLPLSWKTLKHNIFEFSNVEKVDLSQVAQLIEPGNLRRKLSFAETKMVFKQVGERNCARTTVGCTGQKRITGLS